MMGKAPSDCWSRRSLLTHAKHAGDKRYNTMEAGKSLREFFDIPRKPSGHAYLHRLYTDFSFFSQAFVAND